MIQFPLSKIKNYTGRGLFLILFIQFISVQAQETSYSGVILSSDTTFLLKEVIVVNLNSKISTASDANGFFSLVYKKGDSIEFRHNNWEPKLVTDLSLIDSVFLQKRSIVLDKVTITGKRSDGRIKDLQEIQKGNNKKGGIYYGGKPPIALLSPFGGKPITFFYELFSKSGKRARKMNNTIQSEINNSEIDLIFNSSSIQTVSGKR